MIVYVYYCVCEGDGVREFKSVIVSWGKGEVVGLGVVREVGRKL